MGTLKGLVIGVALLCVLWAMPAHATVDWTDGFEYANATALYSVWEASCPPASANPTVSTVRAYSGSKSLRLTFNGESGTDPGAGGCFMDRYLNAASDTLYDRYYMYMDNFTVNSTGTKTIFEGNQGFYPSFWWNMLWGAPVVSVSVQGIILNNGTQDTEVVYGSSIPQNQWVCVETRITMSAPGVDNGIVQAWINGSQVINKTNQRMRAATLNQLNSPTAQFTFVRHYVQHGVGSIYYDDHAVSRNARIGCTGSPAGDIQAPRAPSNLR